MQSWPFDIMVNQPMTTQNMAFAQRERIPGVDKPKEDARKMRCCETKQADES